MATNKSPAPVTGGAKKVVGRPFKKGGPGGPGRPALPKWFKDRGEKSLRFLADAYADEEIDMNLRIRAAETVAHYIYGGPGKARVAGAPMPADSAERIKLLETVVAEAAANGNAEAAVRMLEALDPTRWGKKQSEGDEDEQVDTVDFEPLVKAT